MRINQVQEAYSKAIYGDDSQLLETMIAGRAEFTTEQRVNIYQNNVAGTLKKVLSSVFTVTETLVGKDYFNQLAGYYVKHHPSTHRNLDFYGSLFPEILKKLINKRFELKDLIYLPDVAKLEWLLHQSYYASDRIPFDMPGFAQLGAEQQTQVVFKLADDIALLESPYPVYDIWQYHQYQEGVVPPEMSHHEDNYILVQRKNWKTEVQLIDAHLFALLTAIRQDVPLIALTSLLEDSPMDIASLIQKGIVVGFKTNHDE